LTVDTEGEPELQAGFRTRALVSGVLLAPAAALTFVLARDGAPQIFARLTSWWAPLLVAVTSVCAIGALAALWSRRFRWARAASTTMRLATEPTMVTLPARVDAMARSSQARAGSGSDAMTGFRRSTAGTLETTLLRTAVTIVKIAAFWTLTACAAANNF